MSIKLFNEEEQEQIKLAIQAAEFQTSGEIRVFVESRCKDKDVFDRAIQQFHALKMHETVLRNGVLIYLAVDDKKFAIVGDQGINEKVANNFWDSIKECMLSYFVKNEMASGLKQGIAMVGEQLKTYFPYQNNDKNELPDEIAFS
jgi:uncharacterized membrane protein